MNWKGGANKARGHWKFIFGKKWRAPGNTRWWAVYELILFLHISKNMQQFVEFIRTAEDDAEMHGVRINRLRQQIADREAFAYLKLEFAVISLVC